MVSYLEQINAINNKTITWNELLKPPTMWINLENIVQRGSRPPYKNTYPPYKNTYCVISFA